MVEAVLKSFEGCSLKVFYEGTIGAAGHARAILEAHPEIERYVACDRDPEALAIAKEELASFGNKVDFVHGDFADLDLHLKEREIDQVDGFFLTWGSHRCN